MGEIKDFLSHFIWTIDEKSCCTYETASCKVMGLASLDLSDNSACSKINFVLINSFINIVLILVTVVRNFLLLLLKRMYHAVFNSLDKKRCNLVNVGFIPFFE